MAYAPTLYVSLDDNPCPRVEVLFDALDSDAATVTIFRSSEGRQYEVRGAVRTPVAGSVSRLDFEVPFGVVSTYSARMYNTAGASIGTTSSTSVRVDFDGTWIHNPVDPAGAVQVNLLDTPGDVSRPIKGEVVYPAGRSVGVLISGDRQGVVGYPLMVETLNDVDRNRVAAMLGVYGTRVVPVLCVRTGYALDIPRPFFVAVLEPRRRALNPLSGGTIVDHTLTGDEVAPPTPGIIVPLLTNADLNAFYGANTALNSDNVSNLGVNRRYDLAGTA